MRRPTMPQVKQISPDDAKHLPQRYGLNAPIAYRIETAPAPGEAVPVAPGIDWLRMPLPFALNHINLWLLADGDGWTGRRYRLRPDADQGGLEVGAWQNGVSRACIVTHCHPDHLGLAPGWSRKPALRCGSRRANTWPRTWFRPGAGLRHCVDGRLLSPPRPRPGALEALIARGNGLPRRRTGNSRPLPPPVRRPAC